LDSQELAEFTEIEVPFRQTLETFDDQRGCDMVDVQQTEIVADIYPDFEVCKDINEKFEVQFKPKQTNYAGYVPGANLSFFNQQSSDENIIWDFEIPQPTTQIESVFSVTIPERFVDPKEYRLQYTLSHSQYRDFGDQFLHSTTAQIDPQVIPSFADPVVYAHDEYSNIPTDEEGLRSMFILETKNAFSTTPKSDFENIRVQICPTLGSCHPIYEGVEIQKLSNYNDFELSFNEYELQPNLFELIHQTVVGKPLQEGDFVELYIHR